MKVKYDKILGTVREDDADGMGTGTVTSVGLSVPSQIFETPVTNSPITSSGTLQVTLAAQDRNKIFASSATLDGQIPTFRSLVHADLPVLTGYVVGANSVILASDTFLGAFGKTQGQINAIVTAQGNYVLKAGDSMSGDLLFSSGYGIDSVATVGSDVLNIGATNANVINYGNSSTVHNFLGTAIYELQVNSYVTDKLMTLNYGGTTASGIGVGFEIQENNLITGYFKTNAARSGFSILTPAIAYKLDLSLASLTADRVLTAPDVSGIIITTGDTGTVTNTMLAGLINLTTKVTGILPSANGGSGINNAGTLTWGAGGTLGSNAYTSTSYAPIASPTFTGTVTIPALTFVLGSDATGDTYYNSGSGVIARLASVSVGSYMRSVGATTAPVWSTLKLPNTATTNYVAFGTATNTWGESSRFQFLDAAAPTLQVTGTSVFYSALGTGTGASGLFMQTNSTNDAYVCVSGTANNIVTGSAAGDLVLRARANNILFSLNGGSTIAAKLISSGFVVGTGTSTTNETKPLNIYGGLRLIRATASDQFMDVSTAGLVTTILSTANAGHTGYVFQSNNISVTITNFSIASTGFIGIGNATGSTPASWLDIGGGGVGSSISFSGASWTTNGIQLRLRTDDFTDSGTTGTRAWATIATIAQSNLKATNAVVNTNVASLYLAGTPNQSTNVTNGNAHVLYIASGATGQGGAGTSYGLTVNAQTGALTNYAAQFIGGATLFADIKITTAGNGLYIKEGSNATSGVVTLVAGVATISTTKVTVNSRIYLTRQNASGTLGTSIDVTSRIAATSFTITSNGSILDTSDVAWIIVEPA